MRGALFENFIIMEAMKRRYNQGKESNLYFYRDSHQNEIDLILKSSSGLYGIEIKSAMTYHADFEKVEVPFEKREGTQFLDPHDTFEASYTITVF